MPAYVIGLITFTDTARYEKYMDAFSGVFSKFKGRLLSSDDNPQLLEGDWMGDKVVLIEFPSQEDALMWLNSPDYVEIAKDRKAGAETVALMVEGMTA